MQKKETIQVVKNYKKGTARRRKTLQAEQKDTSSRKQKKGTATRIKVVQAEGRHRDQKNVTASIGDKRQFVEKDL